MRTRIITLSLLVGLTAVVIGCKETKDMTEKSANEKSSVIPEGMIGNNMKSSQPGIYLEYMDIMTRPQDDFYQFVNGTWMATNKIPNDRTRWGSFDELGKKTDDDALAILKKAVASGDYAEGTDQWKAIQIFKSVTDTKKRDADGVAPLKPYLAKVDALKSVADLEKLNIEMQQYGGLGLYGMYVYSDMKNSNHNATYIGGGSLGLPERDYYLNKDEESQNIRDKYVEHIARMMSYFGIEEKVGAKKAKAVLAFETSLAESMMSKEDRRDPSKRYNPMDLNGLSKLAGGINWKEYFDGIGAKGVETVIVGDMGYMTRLNEVLKTTDFENIKDYLRWTMINDAAGVLTMELDKANWEFYGKFLNGSEKQRKLEERALSTLNGTTGEALGKLYVDEKFPPEAKVKAEKMVKNVLEAYRMRIKNLDWMAETTKSKAIEKINKLQIKIGYPDKWKDYSELEVKDASKDGTYFNNMMAVSAWGTKEMMGKMGKAVDKTEWFMPPQRVNAYYNPSYNEIVFPAAILQPPFYDYTADMAVNYGGIGAVIGHEVSHGFDDSGASFDADGNLNNWWTEDDLAEFTQLGKKLIAQYDALEPLPGHKVNGTFTLGENIGDLGGVVSAYDGLQMHLKDAGNPGVIDGFTQDQRFFLSWATVWRQLIRDEALKTRLKTDPHSPGRYRGYVPIINMDEFHTAWRTQPGDSMYLAPNDRVQIW